MNTRRVMTWVIFWCSVAVALGALAWVSVEVVALERREANSRVQASRQESIRRALWRLDSTMAPVLAVEAARPSSDYKSLEAMRHQSTEMGTVGLSVLGSQMIDPYAMRYFNFAPGMGEQPSDADGYAYLTDFPESLERDQAAGSQLYSIEQADELAPQESKAQKDSDFSARNRIAQIAKQNSPAQSSDLELKTENPPAKKLGEEETLVELRANSETANPVTIVLPENSFEGAFSLDTHSRLSETTLLGQSAMLGSLTPRWIPSDGRAKLVLVRNAMLDGQPVVQGVELDWEKLESDLIESIDDVLPGAKLVPSSNTQSAGIFRMATIPVALIPPPERAPAGWSWSPARVGLVVTWVAIIATIVAVGVVLRAAIVLSQRRGHFVSAVTHELRTPLTTFRLYAQMLADGMVSDEQVRRDYLSTLKRESERLTGIVENVLEYARLSRARPGKEKAAGVQTLSPGALVARFRPALARRLGQSNLDLVVSLDLEEHQDRTLTVDPHAVERVMMNLIENACKYAAPGAGDEPETHDDLDTRVHLDVRVQNETLEMLVADHGPGIAPGERARIFGEFQRGSRGLGNARSGLGLGLALSRGLAREMDGELALIRRRGHGAEFLLTIPLDPEA